MNHSSPRFKWVCGATLASLSCVFIVAGCNDENIGSQAQPLTAECVESTLSPPPGAWVCGEDMTVECATHAGAYVDFIYAKLDRGQICLNETLSVNEPGPFPPGRYEIVVSASESGQRPVELCTSNLIVVDTVPPAVTTRVVEMWPPNHKYWHITPLDCVTVVDACDPGVKVWFTSASSDEPDDTIGDGHTHTDIVNLTCDGVDLRAERQGPLDGRVYRLGWHAEDAAGNGVDGTCDVVVPHDQSGRAAVDSGADHQVDLAPGSCD